MNMTLYRLLVKQGAPEDEAEAAAQFDAAQTVTAADLKILLTDLKRSILGIEIAQTVLLALLVALIWLLH